MCMSISVHELKRLLHLPLPEYVIIQISTSNFESFRSAMPTFPYAQISFQLPSASVSTDLMALYKCSYYYYSALKPMNSPAANNT